MFVKEANGLKELKISDEIRVPEVKLVEEEFILLELINNGCKEKNFLGRFWAELRKNAPHYEQQFWFL